MVLVCSVSPLFVLLTIVLCVPFHSLVLLSVFISYGLFVPCMSHIRVSEALLKNILRLSSSHYISVLDYYDVCYATTPVSSGSGVARGPRGQCPSPQCYGYVVDRARTSMEEELYRKLDEDGGKKMILKMARDRTEDERDVKRGAVVKDNNGMLITESKEVLRIWAENFKELLNGKGTTSFL